ncbi:MAG: DUF4199 domain-containing protein [Chlorobi bacterium]|nr:DUF4199 domain-containing protein [Chlorobiota bacterium]
MEKENNSTGKWAMQYGLYLGILQVILILTLYFSGIIFESKLQDYLGYVFAIAITWIGLDKYKSQVNRGFLTYGQGLGLGVMISLFSAIFSAATIYILMKLDGSLSEKMLNVIQEKMLEANMPDDMIESMQKVYEMTVKPGMVAMSDFLGKVFTGTIFSLIIAAIVKKNPDNTFYDAVKNVD